jgi:thymidylate synthase
MVYSYVYYSLDDALNGLSKEILKEGVWRKTPKNQEGLSSNILEFPGPVTIQISNPVERYIFSEERKWNPYLPYLESLWLLLGWNDLDDLPGKYVKNLYNFSDDNHTWRAGYGPRIRKYNGSMNQYDSGKHGSDIPQQGYPEIDQLAWVIDDLKNDPFSRRAVITIHDPMKDSRVGLVTKDQPCTRSIHFMRSAEGNLDCYVKMRSNDLLWGFSAVNVFNFTWMQEYVAKILGMPIGHYYHQVDTLHVYEKFLSKIHRIAQETVIPKYSSKLNPRNSLFAGEELTLEALDNFTEDLFEREEKMWDLKVKDFENYEFLSKDSMLKEWESGILAYHWYKRLKEETKEKVASSCVAPFSSLYRGDKNGYR